MSERRSFYRKIAYGVGIVVLLFSLSWLSMPASQTEAGGRLAQLRDEYRLGQATLGEIDPASETMKLATLGLRGVAVNLLWEKANHYKKTEDWTNLTATLEQLAKLQPNFTTFWRFQAWNLSYNVSVEFDDYHDRYYYVRRGIEFLSQGEQYNRNSPRLLWDLGWFIGQKIGRADEHVQYRRLFKTDDDFFANMKMDDLLDEQRDNWLVGKQWYEKGVDAVDKLGMSLGRQSPRIFYSSPAMSQINYAEAIGSEGLFDTSRRAWVHAARDWEDFGNVVIEHSTGVRLRLGQQPELEKRVTELRERLEALAPDIREQLAEEKLASLTTEERMIRETPYEELNEAQHVRWHDIEHKLTVTDRDVAQRIAHDHPERAREALQVANELEREEQRLNFTINYKRDSNYDYWETRCAFEQTQNALDARERMFRARQEFLDQNSIEAKRLYEEGFAKWRLVLDEFPTILSDETITGDDILEYVDKYRQVLDTLDETIDDDFPLWDVIENFDREQKFTDELQARRERLAAAGGARAPAEQAADEANADSDSDSDAEDPR